MAPVPLRRLGRDGPMVPAMGLGLMGLSIAYGPAPSDEERFAVLDRALELGCTNWDSSDYYGDNEDLLGKWFKRTGRRDDVFLATKFGVVVDSAGKLIGVDTSAAHVRAACDRSLARLGVDVIDLYYAHRVNRDTPIEETVRAMAALKAEGKIRHLGLSEVSSATLRRAHKVHPIAAMQVEYSAFTPDIEDARGSDLLATCRELGVAIVAYSPLGRGFLTGSITTAADVTARSVFPRFQGDNLSANVALAGRFAALADAKGGGCTPAQLALAWLLRQGDDIIPIPGTKKIPYLDQNWAALGVSLSDEENAEIRRFVDTADVAGTRYPQSHMEFSLSDTREE